MDELQPDIFLWQGDITRIRCGAIVNAANSGMTGSRIKVIFNIFKDMDLEIYKKLLQGD